MWICRTVVFGSGKDGWARCAADTVGAWRCRVSAGLAGAGQTGWGTAGGSQGLSSVAADRLRT